MTATLDPATDAGLAGAAEAVAVTARCVDLAFPAVTGQGTEFAVAESAMDAVTVDALIRDARAAHGDVAVQQAQAARLLAATAAERAVSTLRQVGGETTEPAASAARLAVHPTPIHQVRSAIGAAVHAGRFQYDATTLPLPPELVSLRALVRRFVTEQLLPHEARLNEDGDLPVELWAELERRGRELDLNALGLPAEHGGMGLGLVGQLVAAEEMGRVAVGFRHVVGTPPGSLPLARHGTAAQHAAYLRPWLRGERWGAWATTEPEAGSDLAAIRTVAVRDGDGWRIDGAKHFITGLDRADFVITFAKTDPDRGLKGLTAFLVDLDAPGVEVGREQHMMGREGLHSFELRYDGLHVGDDARLGEPDEGFRLLIADVSRMRVLMAGHCLGVAARLIDIAADWGRGRVQFGRPIGEFEALQWYLADSAAELLACRSSAYRTAMAIDAGQRAQAESATVKAYGTELACRVADRAMQILGGTGYCTELPVEALYRAVRLWRIAEGSSEIQRMLVGRQLAAGWRPEVGVA
ncbi:acyl-CoA dehydrogenase family protein [Jiangella anatolica]|uniref:Acyl-CoA dehydrogenase n=1 Tax=Jiangella anatolica TaxID=2670374 RepID=A0A2W2CC44_9ACTN|nr:acyl-CoA dehydrogenase family protein [Jiangella anatolica]PZF83346.1 hypothetical protein C1I92_12965 [Jiangella anatolica]